MVPTSNRPSATAVKALAFLLMASLAFALPVAPVQADAGVTDTESGPDLRITALSVSPADPEPGSVVTVTVGIANVGTADVEDPIRILVESDDWRYYGSTYTYGLGAGENQTVTFDDQLSEGHYALTATVDADEWIEESDETNNQAGLLFTVGDPMPDLVPSFLFLVPAHVFDAPEGPEFPWATVIREGDPMQLLALIDNQGTANAGPFTVRTYLDDQLFDERTVQPDCDCPWEDFELLLDPWNATVGLHSLRVVADPLDEVAEKNETNNEKILHFEVLATDAPVPDLAVVDVAVPDGAQVGDWVSVTVTIENTGDADADAFDAFVDVGLLGDTFVRFPGLDVGDQAQITVGGQLPIDGEYWNDELYWYAVIDPWWYSEVPEDNETNNFQYGAIPIALPDLEVTDVTFPEGPFLPGEEVTAFIHVLNNGTAPAYGPIEVEYDYGWTRAKVVVSDLSPGLGAAIGVPVVPAPFSYFFVAVDPDRRIGESDDWDNSDWFEFEFTGGINVDVKMVSGDGHTVHGHESATFYAYIENLGDLLVTDAQVEWYIDGAYQETDDVTLREDGTMRATFSWTTSDRLDTPMAGFGEHEVTAFVWPDGYDDDWSDNEDSAPFMVKVTPLPPWV